MSKVATFFSISVLLGVSGCLSLGQTVVPRHERLPNRPLFVEALILVESGGNPKVISSAGARGLVQVMPGTARYLLSRLEPFIGKHSLKDLHDPKLNLLLGQTYLLEMLYRYGDFNKALTAYNAGPGNVDRGYQNNYADKVLRKAEF